MVNLYKGFYQYIKEHNWIVKIVSPFFWICKSRKHFQWYLTTSPQITIIVPTYKLKHSNFQIFISRFDVLSHHKRLFVFPVSADVAPLCPIFTFEFKTWQYDLRPKPKRLFNILTDINSSCRNAELTAKGIGQ